MDRPPRRLCRSPGYKHTIRDTTLGLAGRSMSLIHWVESIDRPIAFGESRMSTARRFLSILLALLFVAACAPTPPAAAPATSAPAAQPTSAPKPALAAPVSGEVVVFAASSLTDVFQAMASAFQQTNPNAKVTFNFGASSQLAQQLGQGARADVFASADQTQMDNAKKADAIAGQDRVFARNRLVVITPKDNPKQITAVKDLSKDGVKFVTAQPSVPIGQYTSQM